MACRRRDAEAVENSIRVSGLLVDSNTTVMAALLRAAARHLAVGDLPSGLTGTGVS
jgi:hypothetical protein